MAELRSNYKPRDYDGGESLDNFHSNFQVLRDIEFMQKILPPHYKVQESTKRGSIHCKSEIGIRHSPHFNKGILIDDEEDEEMWGYIMLAIKKYFADRFVEVFHSTCFCHVDFTVYVKQ